MSTPQNQAYARRELFEQFANRLRADWNEHYHMFGDSWEAAISKDTFRQAVEADIRRDERVNQAISKSTIHRTLQAKNFSPNTQKKTLNGFSQYLGYRDWKAFAAAHPTPSTEQDLASPTIETATETPVADTVTPLPTTSANSHTGGPITTYMIALAVVLLIFWVVYQAMALGVERREEAKISVPPVDTTALKETLFPLIEAANAATFDAYSASPDIDTSALAAYYLPDGSAYGDIIGVVERSAQAGNVLVRPTSQYDILSARLITYTNTTAQVQTTEKWKLLWHTPNDPEQGILYDELNKQTYYLEMNDAGDWKIRVNHYEGINRPPSRPPVLRDLVN